jgi:4-oxalocrotonate tautomerase
MPHITVKLWPGVPDEKKQELANAMVVQGMKILGHGEEAFSVVFEEIPSERWKEKVYDKEIMTSKGKLYKKPGYEM